MVTARKLYTSICESYMTSTGFVLINEMCQHERGGNDPVLPRIADYMLNCPNYSQTMPFTSDSNQGSTNSYKLMLSPRDDVDLLYVKSAFR